MTEPIISIIIPVVNEAPIIEEALWQVKSLGSQRFEATSKLRSLKHNPQVEIIVVDGGSQDETVNLAKQSGVTVITSSGIGRAYQMNAGAAIAQGDILLFLHVDTQLPVNYEQLVQKTLSRPKVIAGAFELAIDGPDKSLRLVETLVKMRSRFLSLPYGDQAIFLTKQVFQDMGGFAELPIMEDFELVQRLKRRGKIAIAPVPVITSSRRWQKLGVLQTTAINQLIILGYYLGISPSKLKKFYRNFGNQAK